MMALSQNWVDMASVLPPSKMAGETPEETRLLQKMQSEAEDFLGSHKWCKRIVERYFGYGVGGVLAIFLFRIVPTNPTVDEWLWTVVGDLPPAYLVTEGNPAPSDALEGYVKELQRWAGAVREGRATDELIPVNVPPTSASVEALQKRLDFIRDNILPRMPGKAGSI